MSKPVATKQRPADSALAALTAREALLVEAVAMRVAEMLSGESSRGMVDAATLARALAVSRAFIYEHAAELGAQRLGAGPKARLRFDIETARAAMGCYVGSQSQPANPSAEAKNTPRVTPRRRRSPDDSPATGHILAVRPRRSVER